MFTFVDVEGSWEIVLKPVDATFNPQKMTIETGDDKITLTNILVGEVWLCSGQSNMQFPVKRMDGAKEVIVNATNSNIRFININKFNFKSSISCITIMVTYHSLHLSKND